jgi:hypothetical protein
MIISIFYRSKNFSMSAGANRRSSAVVHPFPNPSMVSIVLGAQWGDEVSE